MFGRRTVCIICNNYIPPNMVNVCSSACSERLAKNSKHEENFNNLVKLIEQYSFDYGIPVEQVLKQLSNKK